jgi:hypothetical protein
MHHLTCMDADRLTRDLREAEEFVRQAAHFHADQYAAMRILGAGIMADYHHGAQINAAAAANQIASYAERLADRKPLWDTGTGPSDEPRPAARLPRPNRRTAVSRR